MAAGHCGILHLWKNTQYNSSHQSFLYHVEKLMFQIKMFYSDIVSFFTREIRKNYFSEFFYCLKISGTITASTQHYSAVSKRRAEQQPFWLLLLLSSSVFFFSKFLKKIPRYFKTLWSRFNYKDHRRNPGGTTDVYKAAKTVYLIFKGLVHMKCLFCRISWL